MKGNRGYRATPFTVNRRMAAASATVCHGRNTIHGMAEVDVTEPRRLLRRYRDQTGETLSFAAFVVVCLSRALAEHPQLNAVRRGRKLFLLDDVTVATLVERTIDDEQVPEPFGIRAAQDKSHRQIHDEIRAAQRADGRLGDLSGVGWVVRFVPSTLFRRFVGVASHSVTMAKRFGVVSVTAVGMFGGGAL